jgi:hypothetical protein
MSTMLYFSLTSFILESNTASVFITHGALHHSTHCSPQLNSVSLNFQLLLHLAAHVPSKVHIICRDLCWHIHLLLDNFSSFHPILDNLSSFSFILTHSSKLLAAFGMASSDKIASQAYVQQYVGMFLVPQWNRPMYTPPKAYQSSLGNQKVNIILQGKSHCGLLVRK